ncbi:hypothetical protein [Dyella amyloliquefaciens]|uniref:hypothetical protein n=1 Tax=Dyella amyloliquefaciens TaxID=1770545 RepID=UPI00102E983B|nr:hypothetical protein [Dyella amyloliquefaciens]
MAKSVAVRNEVRWRVAGSTGGYSSPQSFKVGADIVINGLDRTQSYEFQARSVSACGATSEWADQDVVVIPDASQRVSQANLAMLRVGGIGSAWTGFTISYIATPTSATISCTVGTLQDGVNNPTYAASDVVVTGTAGATVTYYLYYDDPVGKGGTFPLGATTVYSDLSLNQGRISVGSAVVDFPTSGSGSGGGSPGGGGSGCVCIDMWLLEGLLAGDVQVGDVIDGATYEPIGMVDRAVTMNTVTPQPCYRLETESGCVVEASASTPMTMPDGSLRMFPDMIHQPVLVNDRGRIAWERVVSLKPIGIRLVVLLRVGDQCYFAGVDPDRRVATHNIFAAK